MDFNKERAEGLVECLTTNPNSPSAAILMNQLLTEFHRGYPLENLRPLLLSRSEEVVTIAAWIASELGRKGKPLLRDVLTLLRHQAKKIRFSTIDCILAWAGPSDGIALASVITLTDDPEPGVRWKVMDFLARATPQQLQAALNYLEETAPKCPYLKALRWLLGPQSRHPEEVTAFIQSQESICRKYGAVAAVRISKENRGPLFFASSVDDVDVRDFAQSGITLL